MLSVLLFEADSARASRKQAQNTSFKHARGGPNRRQQFGPQTKSKKQKHSHDRDISGSRSPAGGHVPACQAVPNAAKGGSQPENDCDSEAPSDIDPDDLQAIADVLQATTAQEQRLVAEGHEDEVKPSLSGWAAAGDIPKPDKSTTHPATLKGKGLHANARDHVAKSQSAHVPQSAHKQVYGTTASSFDELGLNEVCLSLPYDRMPTCMISSQSPS